LFDVALPDVALVDVVLVSVAFFAMPSPRIAPSFV